MSNRPRKQSEANMYHVFSRGAGRRTIYEDDEDRQAFLRILERSMEEHRCRIFAYCLMGNHYHLVIEIEFESLPHFMHKVNWEYARFHNERHRSSGHLFDGRYGSQAIHDEEYLLQAIRYVHRNPVEASICPTCDYPWSSYSDYLESSGITSTGIALELLGGRTAFEAFHKHAGKESFIDDSASPIKISANSALSRAYELLDDVDPCELKTLDKAKRDEYLAVLRASGLTVAQITLVTGISQPTVSRATATK